MSAHETLEALATEFAASSAAPNDPSPANPIAALAKLIASLRPQSARDLERPTLGIRALIGCFASDLDLRNQFRRSLLQVLDTRRGVSLYTDGGMFPNRGFFGELLRRVSHSVLPDTSDSSFLRDALGLVFDRGSDAAWVRSVPDEVAVDLIRALGFDDTPDDQPRPLGRLVTELLESLRVISYRVASIGLEPELLRVEPDLDEMSSPFLTQNLEMISYLDEYAAFWSKTQRQARSSEELRARLQRCLAFSGRIRNDAAASGTSLSLTLHLKRIWQHVRRALLILDVLDDLAINAKVSDGAPSLVALFKRLIADDCRKNSVRDFLSANLELLARRVTENAGRTGDHYITSTRSEYFALFKSAAVGGFVIAFMALVKLLIAKAHLPPMTNALAICLNYGLGFVIIHIIHGSVATKQPAMTAAAIAASLGEVEQTDPRDLEELAKLIARTIRSQVVAVLGNIGVAVPLSILIGLLITTYSTHPFPDADKSRSLLQDLHPWKSGSFFFAAIAGVCLFLSGLISGFYDNMAWYNRIPQRLEALRPLRLLLGPKRARRLAEYTRANLGALAGNFFFGFLLGGVSAVGTLFGLPLDIRHIAFGSAHLGYSFVGLDFALTKDDGLAALGVAMIGSVNLGVSFALSLWVAGRSRRVTIGQSGKLLRSIFNLLRQAPREFLLPPKKDPTSPEV